MRESQSPRKNFVSTLTNTLASVRFAVTVVVIIAVVCVIGTVLPQGADVNRHLHKYPTAVARMEWLGRLGLTRVFSSWWFIGLLCVLSASVATCSTRRFATVRRAKGYSRGRALGSMLTHISFLLILGGAVVRSVWGQKGYLEFHEGETAAQFVSDRGAQPLPFQVRLDKFEIETYYQKATEQLLVALPEKNLKAVLPVALDTEQKFADFTIKILKYVPDLVVDMQTREITSRSSVPRNPAIFVAVNGPTYQNHRWLFAKFPDFGHSAGQSPLQMIYTAKRADGPIKSFKSMVQFDGRATTIEVNSPFSYRGYTFYQSGYNPNDLTSTTLQVVKDPGVPVVYAGFGLMIAGLFIVFYLNPWLNERRNQS